MLPGFWLTHSQSLDDLTPGKSCLSQRASTVAAGKLLNTFVAVGGFQLLLERSHTARAGILLNSLRAAAVAGEEIGSSAFQFLLGFLFGFAFSAYKRREGGQNGFLAAAPVGLKNGSKGLSSKSAIVLKHWPLSQPT